MIFVHSVKWSKFPSSGKAIWQNSGWKRRTKDSESKSNTISKCLCQAFCGKNGLRLQIYGSNREKNMFRKYNDRLCSLADEGKNTARRIWGGFKRASQYWKAFYPKNIYSFLSVLIFCLYQPLNWDLKRSDLMMEVKPRQPGWVTDTTSSDLKSSRATCTCGDWLMTPNTESGDGRLFR